MNCRIFILFVAVVCAVEPVVAQKLRTATVSGEYSYYPPETMSLEQAKSVAVERARLEAIASEFGTSVSQTNTLHVSNRNGDTDSDFQLLGQSEVNGDWLADTREPEITVGYDAGMLQVSAKVWGRIRERKRAEFDLSIETLCNGMASERFRHNDRFSVRFRSPVNGFLSIWLADDVLGQLYCLLPYEDAGGVARAIESRKVYTLLSTDDPAYPYREETILTTEQEVEFNRAVFIFSTSNFSMPLTSQGEFLPELSVSEFNKWLQRNRVKDENMYVTQKVLEIKK